MASTVVALILRENHFACLWAGDSRLYLAREGTARRLTVDHSLVQDLQAAGVIDPEEARDHPDGNVITRAIGAGEQDPELDKRMGEVVPGDRFLLCSDGLCKSLSDDELALRLSGGAVAGDLIVAALERAASDNVTAVLVDVAGDDRLA